MKFLKREINSGWLQLAARLYQRALVAALTSFSIWLP